MTDNPIETVRDAGEVIRLLREATGLAKSLRSWFGGPAHGPEDMRRMRDVAVDLEERVLHLREEALVLRDELTRVREDNQRLRSVDDVASRINYVDEPQSGVTVTSPKAGEPPGACCRRCWEVDRKLVSLYEGSATCPQCWLQRPH